MYVCNLAASEAGLCNADELGQFIVDMPSGVSINDTSVYTTAVRFDARASQGSSSQSLGVNKGPFRYQVRKTGYYCVGAVPVTISTGATPASDGIDTGGSNDTTTITTYSAVVDFQNTFEGHLPASEYPKIYFYGFMAFVYAIIGAVWAFFCWKHRSNILPIQHYITATIVIIVVELLALSGYYGYLNNSGVSSCGSRLIAAI